ncbi:hypothetical protein B5807_11005 [Epicoccum nigrum]|uniref:Prolyl 4-hydroxylase alpha subunit domain-containing protein n=1 Tax=Epicoccum nigrum TaxID=105696 RepID=A0A1Y2LK42_EPING|nr:hypothetical protein B5807_11005 [Epicoccum nigrum]
MLPNVNLLPLALLLTLASATTTSTNTTCPPHDYTTHILSLSPLVVYIPNFLTRSETTHLQLLSAGKFSPSQIADTSGQQHLANTRTSQSASLSSDNEVVRCIEQRALDFQGFDVQRERLEPLQLVQYSASHEFHSHTDWFTSPAQTTRQHGGNRVSSFFVYVHASDDLVGGGTRFPLLDAPASERWCGWLDCDAETEDGVVFRPVEGNAVFWRNDARGGSKGPFVGDGRVVHAGLPVQRGRKVGMNVWTREGALDESVRGGGV